VARQKFAPPDGPGIPLNKEARSQCPSNHPGRVPDHCITHNVISIELVEADETPAVVIVSWPLQPTVLHPRRFPDVAAMVARLFATASTELANIKSKRGL
jgi:hypothetical protein